MPEYDEVLQQVLDIFNQMVPEGGPQVSPDLDLVNDLGLDSMKVLEILEAIEDSFDISIPINIMPVVRTVKDLAVEIEKITGSES
jgi:acyl carrier protein